MSNAISNLALRLHQAVVEPALVFALRAKRLAMFGMGIADTAELPVEWHRPGDCRAPCPLHADKVPKLLRRYARVDDRAAGLRLTPMGDSQAMPIWHRACPVMTKAAWSGWLTAALRPFH